MPDLPVVYRGLAALHRAGIRWPEALASVAERDPGLHVAREAVAAGKSLPEALAPLVPGLDAALLEAGEASGALDRTFDTLAERHDDERKRHGQRRAALAYPVLLAHIAALLLPIPDFVHGRILVGLGWSALILLPVYGLMALARRTPRGDRRLPHRFPWTNMVEEQDAAALSALGALYDAGVPLSKALPLAARAGPNGRAAEDLRRADRRVMEGLDLAGAWHALPTALTGSLVIGERTGSLGKALRDAAERLAFDVEMRRKRLAARLPPLLMLTLGVIIGARVLGFYAAAFRGLPGIK